MMLDSEIVNQGPRMSLILRHFNEEHPEIVDRADTEFYEYVEADLDEISDFKLNQLFSEWFVFDFKLKTGKSPLETYVHRNPDQLNKEELRDMRAAGKTEFTSTFHVGSVDHEKYEIELIDMETGKKYLVYDLAGSRQLEGDDGLLAVRIYRIQGKWYMASDPIYFLPIPFSQERRDELISVRLAPGGEDLKCGSFIEIVRTIYGCDDSDIRRRNFSSEEDDDFDCDCSYCAPYDFPEYDSVFCADFTFSSEEKNNLMIKRAGIKQRFDSFCEKYDVVLDWDELLVSIYLEDDGDSPASLAAMLLRGDVDDEFMVSEFLDCFVDAWNHFPHMSLGCFAPCELDSDLSELSAQIPVTFDEGVEEGVQKKDREDQGCLGACATC